MTHDIEVSGNMGFYSIHASSEQGRKWMRKVQGFDGHQTFTDDTRCAQDITDGAFDDGLAVAVNGQTYIGEGSCAKAEPWLKIDFCSWLPGTAMVIRSGRKRRVATPGQWFVFDKNCGAHAVLFRSGDIDECHKYIDQHSARI